MEELTLRELIDIILREKWIIALVTALCVLVTGVYSFYIAQPVYEVKTRFVVAPVRLSGSDSVSAQINVPEDGGQDSGGIIKSIASDLMIIKNINSTVSALLSDYELNMDVYKYELTSPTMLQRAIDELNLPLDWRGLKSKVGVAPMKDASNKDTSTIEVTVNYNNPEVAVNIANFLYTEFDKKVNQRILDKSGAATRFITAQKDVEMQKYLDAVARMSELEEIRAESIENQKEYDDLKHKAALAKKTYEAYHNKLDEFEKEILVRENLPVVRVVMSPYMPTNPIAPKKALNVAVAAMLGLMAGIFLAFFKDYWANSGSAINTKVEVQP